MNNTALLRSWLSIKKIHDSVIVDCKRLVGYNLSHKLRNITLLPYRCVHSGLGGERWTETSSQPITADDEVYIFCVRILLDMNWEWTCAKVSIGTDVASSAMTKPTQFENAGNLRMTGMTHSDGSKCMAIYANHRTAYESLRIIMWGLSSPGLYDGRDTHPFTLTRAEYTVK